MTNLLEPVSIVSVLLRSFMAMMKALAVNPLIFTVVHVTALAIACSRKRLSQCNTWQLQEKGPLLRAKETRSR